MWNGKYLIITLISGGINMSAKDSLTICWAHFFTSGEYIVDFFEDDLD